MVRRLGSPPDPIARAQSARAVSSPPTTPGSADPGPAALALAPVPSAAAELTKAPSVPGVPVQGAFALRVMETGAQDGTVSTGERFLAAAVDDIARRVAAGESVRVVFDLDNTLFDTRARTLAVVRMFDEQTGSDLGSRIRTVDHVGKDADATLARHVDVPADVRAQFAAFWEREFWNPANLVHDAPMPELLRWVKEAQDAGAEVRYLTGRVTDFHAASLAQLRTAGVAVDDEDVVCKPGLDSRTAPFKTETMARWGEDAHIAFFLTEGRRDIEHVQANLGSVPCVMLDSSFESAAHAVAQGTPALPRLM